MNRAPQDFVLLGSADSGNTWTLLDSRSEITDYSAAVPMEFDVNTPSTAGFSLFRLVVMKNRGLDVWLSIYGFNLMGYKIE